MSQRFFYGFGLTILFVSIHLLSMHDHKLNRKLDYSRDAENNEHNVLLSSLSSTPYFKQQSIVLQNNDANQHPLIFNRNQQPCITQYLLEGKPVAKLMQINNAINFASDDYKICNFSLQVPYQVDSLTINTQGRLIFEKKINAYSAYITGKTINFCDEFFSNNGLIIQADTCKTHAQLTCCDFLFKGKKFKIMPKSSLNMHNSLTLTAQSLILNEGMINCKKESLIKSSLFKNSGTFTSHNMRFDGHKINNQGMLSIEDTFHCASKFFDHSGMLDVSNNCIMEKGDVFSATSSSVWHVKGDWKLFITSLYLKGSFTVKNLYFVGKNFIAESPLHCIAENACLKIQEDMINAGVVKILGLLDVDSKNIKLERTSNIIVDNADLKVNQAIENEGTISVKNHLSAHSRSISNAGKIETNSSNIKTDLYFYNKILSTLSAKNNLTIHTPFSLNLFGLTHAQNLTINSAIGFNALGIYAAKNMSFNTLFSLNAGLLLPKFSTFAEMYSPENLWGLGESLFIRHIPICGIIYAALKNIYGTYYQGRAFYSEVGSLRKQKSIESSGVIALLCSIKNMFSSVQQSFNLGKQSHSLLSHCYQAYNSQSLESSPDTVTLSSDSLPADNVQNLESSPDVVARAKDVTQQIISTIASHYAPSVNTTSIIDLNQGIAIGVDNHSSSLYHRNSNISLYVNNTIDTRDGDNVGTLGAYNLNVKTTNSYNSDGTIKVSDGNIDAYNLFIQGPINALKDIALQGKDSANIKGNVSAKKIDIKYDRYITISSHLTSLDTHLHAKYITQRGMITAQKVNMTGDNISNDGTVKAPKIIITQANLPRIGYWFGPEESFFNEGSLQTSDQLFVAAKNISLNETSQISSPNAYFKSDGNWKNNGTIDSQQLAIDTRWDAENSGSLHASDMHIKSKYLSLKNTSDIAAKNAYFQTTFDWKNNGNINAEQQLILDADRNVENSGSLRAPKIMISQGKSEVRGWYANSRAFLNTGSIQASDRLSVDAKNITLNKKSEVDAPNADFTSADNWHNDGKLKTEKCVIDAEKQVINNGTINASLSLKAKGQNILFQKESIVNAKDACYTAERDVSIDGLTDIERGSVNAGGKVRAIGKLGASNRLDIKAEDIVIERKSHVSTPTADLKATQTIHNQGKLSTSDLCAHAKYVKNSGTIISDNKAHIKADRCFWNQWGGSIDVENSLTIDALVLLNTLGYMSADSLCTNSIIDANLLSIYRGNNICQNSFISYNRGIFIPKFKSLDDIKKILKKNPLRFAESFVLPFIPRLGKIYSLLKSTAMCFGNSKEEKNASLWGRATALKQHINDLYDKQDLCVSDVVPALCQTKNLLTSAIQTGYQISEAYQEGQQIYQAGEQAYQTTQDSLNYKSDTTENSTQEQKASNKNTIPIFSAAMPFIGSQISTAVSTAMSIAGPQLSKNSLLDINYGLMLGVNGDSQSLYNMNAGVSLFAHNNSVSTISGTNTGFIGGGNVSINTFGSYSSNGITAAANLAITAHDLAIAGNTYAFNNVLLRAHSSAVIDREIKAKNVAIYAKNILIKENTSIVFRDTTNVVATEKVVNKGTIDGKQTTVQGNEVILKDGSRVLAQRDVVIKAEKLLNVQTGAQVYAKDTTKLHSDKHAIIDGSVTGNKTSVEANTLDVQESAHISSKSETTVVATEKLTNKGAIYGKQTLVQGSKVILDNGSTIDTHGDDAAVVINATTLHLKDGSRIDATTALITAQSIQGEEGNTITSINGTLIKTNQIDNKETIRGPVTLKFSGDASQLKGIGAVDQLTYSGTLESNIADRLANGHNELLNVGKGGAVVICAQEQDVHLKEQHDISHILCVQTDGSIQCDKDLLSDKSIWLQAKGDLQHASVRSKETTRLIGKNISSKGHVTREDFGENYTDTCEKNKVYGNHVVIHAAGDLQYKGTDVCSGVGGTNLLVVNNLIADVLVVEKYTKSEKSDTGKSWKTNTTTEEKTTTSIPCAFTSDGATTGYIGNVAKLSATIFTSKGGTNIQAEAFEEVPTYDTHMHREETKQTGYYNGTTTSKSFSENLNPIRFDDDNPTVISSDNPVSMHVAGNTSSITINAPAVEILVAQQATHTKYSQDGRYVGLLGRGNNTQSTDIVSDPAYSGTINTNAQAIHIEDTKNSAPAIVNATDENAHITRSLIEDLHEYQKQSYNRPTPLLMNTAALLFSMGTHGLGASLGVGFKIGLAGINAFGWNTAHTFLYCDGDYRGAAKKMVSPQAISAVIVAALISATTFGADKVLNKVIPPLSHAATFGQRVAYTVPRELAHGGIKAAGDIAQGKKPKEAAKQQLKLAAANTLGIALSSQIGQVYGDGKIGPGMHKALHTCVGALQGAIIDGKDGAIAGAIGAGVAETVADIFSPKAPSIESMIHIEAQLGRSLTQDEFVYEWNRQLSQYLKQTHSVANASKITAATIAVLAQQDMNIAYNTAAKAVDNNFLVLAMYGITGLSTAYSAYQIHKTYKQEGTVEALKHLGIEIACNAACLGASKVAFKFGGKLYPSARLAINAALDRVPGVKLALGNVAESLITTAEKLAGSSVGKQIARANQYINPLETHLINFENKIADKVGNVTKQVVDKAIKVADKAINKVGQHLNPSFAEDLVEHIVPGSVLNQVEKHLSKKATKEGARQLALPAPEKFLLLPNQTANNVGKETTSVLSQDVSLSMEEISKEYLNNSSKTLLESAYAKIAPEVKEEIATIKKIYDRTKDGFAEFAHIKVTMEYEHILGMELGLTKKGKLAIDGFHHDLKNVIEKSNILNFTNKILNKHGCYSTDLLIDDFLRIPNKTFFPAHWSRTEVISKINEAYGNFIKSGIIPKRNNEGKYMIQGFTSEGIEIKMYFTVRGKMKTAYPIVIKGI